MNNKERALTLIDELKDRGAINNREVGTLRRAILLNEQTEVKGDLISREALMPLFIKKANTMKDRHGVKLGEEWLLNYNDIKEVIDNAPTVEAYTEDDVKTAIREGHEVGYEMAKAKFERPTGEWIMNKTSARGRNYTCTNCQKVSRNKSEFCPKCGADMRL